jgi:hypothetical protein
MTIELNGMQLPVDLIWSDEYESQSVSQTVRRTLDGGVVVYHSSNFAGRSITLESSTDSGWVTRDVVKTLSILAASPGAQYSLVIRGEVFNVIFRHNDSPAFDASPIVSYSDPIDSDFFTVSIKFVTI